MKFTTLFAVVGLTAASVSADLVTLPYDSLPNATSTKPNICNQLGSSFDCHGNTIVTMCLTQGVTPRRFCWGSDSLSQENATMPSACQSSFNSTATCNSNQGDTQVLCVDQYAHYCYGSVGSDGTFTSENILSATTTTSSTPQNNSAGHLETTMALFVGIIAAAFVTF